MGMGYVLGDYFTNINRYNYSDTEPVLIVKHCQVLPLAIGWKPPSSKTLRPRGGVAYEAAIQTYQNALDNLDEFIPGYYDSGYEITAFVWIHGYYDACALVENCTQT
jgi:hypothetical protein